MNRHQDSGSQCIEVCAGIFAGVGKFTASRAATPRRIHGELVRSIRGEPRWVRFTIALHDRVTPQTAGQVLERLIESKGGPNDVSVLYAPTISPRVAAMAREIGVSFIDGAGNCRIVDHLSGLFIERSGRVDASQRRKQRVSDAFSPKSSRVVRAMLHDPSRSWKVEQLAKHADVGVSVGLVAKVKDWLIREGYAVIADRRLSLTRPTDLLNAWAMRYQGAVRQTGFYLRGDTPKVEDIVASWCAQKGIQYAFNRLSAAWRLAPDIRYSVATLYIHAARSGHQDLAESLRKGCGAAAVDTGANLLVLDPSDESVFSHAEGTPVVCTSPLQTYLDLRNSQGRGADAAQAIFDQYIRVSFEQVEAEGKK